jgi:predicted nucleotidyltransferase
MFRELIEKVAIVLGDKGIPYMIIGGQAVILYGEPRLTRDVDVTLGIGTERLPEVLGVAEKIGLRPLPENPASFTEETMVLPTVDDSTGVRVDFIFSYTPYEQEAIKRANKISFGEVFVSFASPEDVIVHKIFAGRPRDIEDVRSIILKNPGIDRGYIIKWLAEFDKSVAQAGFTELFENLLH